MRMILLSLQHPTILSGPSLWKMYGTTRRMKILQTASLPTSMSTRTACNKVYACWHILDRYRGRYINRNLTRNMVDIKVTVPEMNIVFEEHFCFKYFSRSKGSPYTLFPEILKGAVCKIYNKYYTDQSYENAKGRIHFTCVFIVNMMKKMDLQGWWSKMPFQSGTWRRSTKQLETR